jgi:hypothetical protein
LLCRVSQQDYNKDLRISSQWMLLSCARHLLIWYSARPPVNSSLNSVFSFSLIVALRYQRALQDQPVYPLLPAPLNTIVPAVLFAVGQTFVISSTYALGVTGTFLGDYFGILMDSRVEGFPFNVLRDPMYVGSTMCFAATALWYVACL